MKPYFRLAKIPQLLYKAASADLECHRPDVRWRTPLNNSDFPHFGMSPTIWGARERRFNV